MTYGSDRVARIRERHIISTVEPPQPTEGLLWTNPDETWSGPDWPPSDFELFGEVMGTGASSVLSFTNIPQTHRDLLVMAHGNHVGAAANILRGVILRFNGDSGTTYRYVQVYADDNGNPTRTSALGTTNIAMGAWGDDGGLSSLRLEVADYSRNMNNSVTFQCGGSLGGNAGENRAAYGSGTYISGQAITSLQIHLGVSTEFFSSITRARLYGLGLL